MTVAANMYHYDVLNAHYFKGTRGADGTIDFSSATAVALPGLMSMDLSAEGETSKIRADGRDYIVVTSNNGYSGSLHFVQVPNQFKIDCLGEVVDETTDIQYEDADAVMAPFALVGEFKGDSENIRWAFYNVTASRPNQAGDNKENAKEPDEEEIEITASPLPVTIGTGESAVEKNIVRGGVKKSDNSTVWGNWLTTLQLPGTSSEEENEG